MIKYIFCILIGVFLAFGLNYTSYENLPDSLIKSGNPVGISVQCAEDNCCVMAVVDERGADDLCSLRKDEASGRKICDGIDFNITNSQSNVPTKVLKIKACLAIRRLLNLNYTQLSEYRQQYLSFNPSSLRYSYGYYIYTLAHILI